MTNRWAVLALIMAAQTMANVGPLGIPSIAVSLVLNGREHYETAAELVRRLVERNDTDPLPTDAILNVNVPDVPFAELKGVRVTRLGFRHKSEPAVKALDPHNRPIYWIGPAGGGQGAGPGTDGLGRNGWQRSWRGSARKPKSS